MGKTDQKSWSIKGEKGRGVSWRGSSILRYANTHGMRMSSRYHGDWVRKQYITRQDARHILSRESARQAVKHATK